MDMIRAWAIAQGRVIIDLCRFSVILMQYFSIFWKNCLIVAKCDCLSADVISMSSIYADGEVPLELSMMPASISDVCSYSLFGIFCGADNEDWLASLLLIGFDNEDGLASSFSIECDDEDSALASPLSIREYSWCLGTFDDDNELFDSSLSIGCDIEDEVASPLSIIEDVSEA